MYFGHTWSPILELKVSPSLLHGQEIAVDIYFSATLAHYIDLLPDSSYQRFLSVFSRAGLAIDNPAFDLELMLKATASTNQDTRWVPKGSRTDQKFGDPCHSGECPG